MKKLIFLLIALLFVSDVINSQAPIKRNTPSSPPHQTKKSSTPKANQQPNFRFSILDENAATAVLEKANENLRGSIVIPETTVINGKTYSVTSIGNHAFDFCEGITSITIPNSVTTIGEGAFWACKGLKSITIPDSVTIIDKDVFYYCRKLTNITIPASVSKIESNTFDGCRSLTKIIVNPDNSYYQSKDGLLFSKDLKKLVRCPEGLKGALVIPDSVTSIEHRAFDNCKGLTSITIPNSVTTIGEGAFAWCNGLTSITIPSSVTTIGNQAFCFSTGLTNITIPSSVTTIDSSTFRGCTGLTSITIPESVTEIGEGAFKDCENLKNIDIPARFLDADGKIKSEYM